MYAVERRHGGERQGRVLQAPPEVIDTESSQEVAASTATRSFQLVFGDVFRPPEIASLAGGPIRLKQYLSPPSVPTTDIVAAPERLMHGLQRPVRGVAVQAVERRAMGEAELCS